MKLDSSKIKKEYLIATKQKIKKANDSQRKCLYLNVIPKKLKNKIISNIL